MSVPLSDNQLAKIRADIQLAAAGPLVGVPAGAQRYEAWVRIGDQHGAALLADNDRLRTLLAAISAKVDQFPPLDDESKASDYDLGRHDLAESVRNIISPPGKPAAA